MRDLGQYLPELKRTRNSKRRSGYNIEFEVLTIEALERAIKAEGEVERLKKVYATTNDSWKKLQTENARLHKVVEAAKDHLNTVVGSRAFKQTGIALGYALAELDEEGER